MVIGVKKDYQVYTDADLLFLFSVFYDLAIFAVRPIHRMLTNLYRNGYQFQR